MAYSDVGIASLALTHIGEGAITSLTATDRKSIAANAVYEYIRDEVLIAHERGWNFAKKRIALAQDATAPASGYDYRYTLPADYLKALDIEPTGTPYVIEAGYLLTDYDNDSDDLVLRYVRRENNPALFSASFVMTFSFRLAAALAFLLVRGSSAVQDRMMLAYKEALGKAMGVNQSEDYQEDDNEDCNTDWLDAGRGCLTTTGSHIED